MREEKLLTPIEVIEEVSGPDWLSEPPAPAARPELQHRWEFTLHVELPELELHAPTCSLVAELNDQGWMLSIRLAQDTTFTQRNPSSPIALLHFPRGTDLQKELSQEVKQKLFKQIKESRE